MTPEEVSAKLRAYLMEMARRPDLTVQQEELEMPIGEAAKLVIERAEKFLMEDEYVRTLIQQILVEIGFEVDLDIAVEYAAIQTNKKRSLPKDNAPVLGLFYNLVVRPCMDFKDILLKELAKQSKDLNPVERELLVRGFDIARLFSKMFSKWWDMMVVPWRANPHSKEEAYQEKAGKAILDRKDGNRYTVLVNQDGTPITEPLTLDVIRKAKRLFWIEAFPEEIARAVQFIKALIAVLPDEEQEYRAYFRALVKALTCRNIKAMEKLWANVDRTWVRIPRTKRIVPVHPMEYDYLVPGLIAFEFRMMVRVQDFADIIETVRQHVKALAAEIGLPEDPAKIECVDIAVFVTFVNGGCSVDFRYAGQSVPNRPPVQRLGMKIFLDGPSMVVRHDKHIRTVRKCLYPKTLQWVENVFTLEAMYALVAGHELDHCILTTKKVIRKGGMTKHNVEEAKATALGIAGIARAVEAGLWGQDGPLTLAAAVLNDCLRMMDRNLFTDPKFKAYTCECMMIITALVRCGLLTIVNGKLFVDRNAANLGLLNRAVWENIALPLIAAYKEIDIKAMEAMLKDMADVKSPEVRLIYNAVNVSICDETA